MRVVNVIIRSYLRHQSVSAGTLVVFELDVRVVVGHQLHEPGIVALDPSFRRSAGGNGELADVGLVLLEHQRLHLARVPELGRTAQRAAALHAAGRGHRAHHQRQREPPPVPGRHRNNATAAVAVPHIRLPDTALPRPLLIQQSVANNK